jgi:hypothetical protein
MTRPYGLFTCISEYPACPVPINVVTDVAAFPSDATSIAGTTNATVLIF